MYALLDQARRLTKSKRLVQMLTAAGKNGQHRGVDHVIENIVPCDRFLILQDAADLAVDDPGSLLERADLYVLLQCRRTRGNLEDCLVAAIGARVLFRIDIERADEKQVRIVKAPLELGNGIGPHVLPLLLDLRRHEQSDRGKKRQIVEHSAVA